MNRICIVTVTYNASHYIEKTVQSVLNQNYYNYEYCIVDGKSSDSTIKLVEKYKEKFENKKIKYTIISEKDNGIFDAMNKSLNYINGDYVLFLNAGDYLASHNVLEDFFGGMKHEEDIIYGDYYLYHKNKRKYISSDHYELLPRKMISTHQAIFTKVELLRGRPYNTNYKMTADYDFYLEMYICGKKFLKVNRPVVYFDANGISQSMANITQKERIEVLFKNGCITYEEQKEQINNIWKICIKKKIKRLIREILNYPDYHNY